MGYISCSKCGGTKGTLVKVDDGRYVHQREQDCKQERQRQAEIRSQEELRTKSNLVIARPKLILPGGQE